MRPSWAFYFHFHFTNIVQFTPIKALIHHKTCFVLDNVKMFSLTNRFNETLDVNHLCQFHTMLAQQVSRVIKCRAAVVVDFNPGCQTSPPVGTQTSPVISDIQLEFF